MVNHIKLFKQPLSLPFCVFRKCASNASSRRWQVVTSSPDNKPLHHTSQCSEALPSSSGKQSTYFRFPTFFFLHQQSSILHQHPSILHCCIARCIIPLQPIVCNHHSSEDYQSIFVHRHRCNASLHRHRLLSKFLRRPSITLHSELSKCNANPSFLALRLETILLHPVCFRSISSELVFLLVNVLEERIADSRCCRSQLVR